MLQDLTEEVGRKTGFRILTYRLDFFGVCSDCLHNEKHTKADPAYGKGVADALGIAMSEVG